MRIVLLLVVTLPVLASPLAADGAPWEQLAADFARYDVDGDGTIEIQDLRHVHEAGSGGPVALILVEARLLEGGDGDLDLTPRLRRLADDIAHEGRRAVLLAVALEAGETHRDGLLVLALRELLREAARQGELEAALLVGRFPDAYLVRTCSWRKKGRVVLRKGRADEAAYERVPYLRRVPEAVAHRADIVLADLDGRWEDVYVEPPTRLETVVAVYPDGVPPGGGHCADLERGHVQFEDFFLVSDGQVEVLEHVDASGRPAGHTLALHDDSADHEVGDADRERPNGIARPDVLVSRLDAYGVARRPRADVAGLDGETLLDAEGRPQTVHFADPEAVPHWRNDLWEPAPALERRLLADYLDRNHAYRTGSADVAWRPASIAHGLRSGYGTMRRAASDWNEGDRALDDVHGDPSLGDVVDWLRRPAVLRTLRAHSDAWGSTFARGDLSALLERVGEPAWSWTPRDAALVPTLEAACRGGKLDWFLLHTLWRRGLVGSSPTFYHHTGCDGISPEGARSLPYHHPTYGRRQGGASLLFFGGGLALVGRAKVFYDEPRGFCEALAEGRTFGAAWARYFDVESRATAWSEVGGDIGRKRAYFWSVLGDATLHLRPGPASDAR